IDAESKGVGQAKEDWQKMRKRLQQIFLREPQSHWCELMEGTDICFAPVLGMADAPAHPHNVTRGTFVNEFGITQPSPAPRFSRTQGSIQRPPPVPGEHTAEVLKDWGVK
ncbi:MAG: CoA transferase, partial [Proteobacteria bacterium]|nr:CoA transferase [Pseudomonadota bacterium]